MTDRETLRSDYDLLLCDPPWRYDFSTSSSRAIENQYATMPIDELAAMRSFLDILHGPNAILFMWTTTPKLAEAIKLMAAWGFTYKTSDVWVKVKRDKNRDQLVLADDLAPIEGEYYGMGFYTRVRHEPILIGTCGDFPPPEPSRRPVSAFYAEVGKHSVKPAIEYERIEAMYPDARRIELFARARREGWDAWGNEVT